MPLGWTVTPDRAKWQSNAAHIVNHQNLLAVLPLSHRELLKNRPNVCVFVCVRRGDDVIHLDAQGSHQVCACNTRAVGVKCQQGSARFTGSSWRMSLPRLIHPAHTWQQVLPGCGGTPTQCIWISHTCPISSAEHGWGNKTTGRKKTGRERVKGAAGCWCLCHWFFISLVVKFIYQLSILCFVSLLYAQNKVTINSIWEYIKKKCLSKVRPHIFLSFMSSHINTFKLGFFCENLYKDLVQIWEYLRWKSR